MANDFAVLLFREDEGNAEQFGEAIAGDIVRGRAETAAYKDDVGTPQSDPDRLLNGLRFIRTSALGVDFKPELSQFPTQVAGVRVQHFPCEQLGSDREKFCSRVARGGRPLQ
jgi:hypothetical protein